MKEYSEKEFPNEFLSEEEAEDIIEGEELFDEYSAHEPDDKLISDIKLKIISQLSDRRVYSVGTMLRRVAAVAAILLIVSLLVVNPFSKWDKKTDFSSSSVLTAAMWDSDDIAADDSDISLLTAELDAIEEDLAAVEIIENGQMDATIGQLEIEVIEIASDFWKG